MLPYCTGGREIVDMWGYIISKRNYPGFQSLLEKLYFVDVKKSVKIAMTELKQK